MPTPEDISDAIAENATGPKKVKVRDHEVEQHPIKDQIAARDDAAAQQAVTKPGGGARFQSVTPVYP